LANGPSVPLVNNRATINYSGLASGKVTTFIISWKNTAGTVSTVNASFQVNEKKLVETEPKDGAEMVLIPAGSFEMGVSKDEPEAWMKRSRPMHTVELDAFYMDVHEVTVGKFSVRETGYEYDRWDWVAMWSPTGKHPMILVTWDDATAYAEWAGKRLPTPLVLVSYHQELIRKLKDNSLKSRHLESLSPRKSFRKMSLIPSASELSEKVRVRRPVKRLLSPLVGDTV